MSSKKALQYAKETEQRKPASKTKDLKANKSLPKVNAELQGFDIGIDRFGTVQSSLPVDQLNQFLNRELKDRKLEERDAEV